MFQNLPCVIFKIVTLYTKERDYFKKEYHGLLQLSSYDRIIINNGSEFEIKINRIIKSQQLVLLNDQEQINFTWHLQLEGTFFIGICDVTSESNDNIQLVVSFFNAFKNMPTQNRNSQC